MASKDVFSFGAVEAIRSGEWDRYLLLLLQAIRIRQIELGMQPSRPLRRNREH